MVALACLFVIAQFIRPAKTNPTVDPALAIESHVQVDPKVSAILRRLSFKQDTLALVYQCGAGVVVCDRPRERWSKGIELV